MSKASANGNTNEIVIGHTATGNGSNSVTLGNSSITKTILRGNVLIGTTTDTGEKLQVFGNAVIGGTGNPALSIASTSGAYTSLLYLNASGGGASKIFANGGANQLFLGTNNNERLTIDSNGIRTENPTGGTSNYWKLGSRVAATVVVNTTQYIEVDIGGTLYKLATVT